MKIAILARGKEQPLLRKHPWVFSGGIKTLEGKPENGDWIAVHSAHNDVLGYGHYHTGSIAVRMVSFQEFSDFDTLYTQKLTSAYALRQSLYLNSTNPTTCFRLVHAEGDGLPGLVIDIYGTVAVVQCHTLGMYKHIAYISKALQVVLGENLTAVYCKCADITNSTDGIPAEDGYIFGEAETPLVVKENGHSFAIDWITGQKTGFFIDQRDNRALLAHYSKDKSVLNTFCYSGGFSIYALAAGASKVHSVDSSKKAIALTEQNIALAKFEGEHECFAVDTFDFFKQNPDAYDIVILDPPAFAKSHSAKHRAVQGYKRLNIEGLKRVKKGGLLFTFSCSQAVDKALFYHTIAAAAIEVGRNVRVLHHLTQPACHPVSMFHPEGEYLKGLVLQVE